MEPVEQLSSRIARLEQDNRSLKLLLRILLGGVVVAMLGFSQLDDKGIQAEEFELVDGQGQVRARLGLEAGGAGLHLMDESGRLRVSLVQDDDQGGLFIRDVAGQIRVGSAQFAHGGGGFALHGPGARGAAVLYLKGEGSLRFIDPEGKELHRAPSELV